MATLDKIGNFLRKTANKAWNPGVKDIANAQKVLKQKSIVDFLTPKGRLTRKVAPETLVATLEHAAKSMGNTAAELKTKGNMKNLAARLGLISVGGLTATGVVGYTLKNIDPKLIDADKYYVLKNDKVIHDFKKKEDAQKYAAVHQGSVNKGTTLKQKVA